MVHSTVTCLVLILAGMAVVLPGWLPHRREAHMEYNYRFPTRTMFSVISLVLSAPVCVCEVHIPRTFTERIAHAKAPIEPATTSSVCQHGEESVLVNVVVTFAQTFRAILVSGTKTVVGLAAQTEESVFAPFYPEQPRRPLVESHACETTRLGGRPWATDYSRTDKVVFVFVVTFGR